jgi:DNA-binding transcriptional LysR family regulator
MSISFNRLDLNLLRVFDAIMEERSVLRAGQRICLSQSAVSHALARLRDMLDDELFIRTPAGMQPTARALAMAPLIREAWDSLEAAIGPQKFDPEKSSRRFTIVAGDFVTRVMAPRLLSLLRREAPHIDLVIRPDNRIDLVEQIDLGQVDVAIGTFSRLPTRFRSNSLFYYDDVLIASSSLELGRLSLEKLSELSMVVISSQGNHGGSSDGYTSERGLARRSDMFDRRAFEQAFSGSKRTPRMAVCLPHFLALPPLLEGADLAAIVPRPLARSLASTLPLSIHELPYKTALLDVGVVWHERNAGNAPQEWLHDVLRRAAQPLCPHLVELRHLARSAANVSLPEVAIGA